MKLTLAIFFHILVSSFFPFVTGGPAKLVSGYQYSGNKGNIIEEQRIDEERVEKQKKLDKYSIVSPLPAPLRGFCLLRFSSYCSFP